MSAAAKPWPDRYVVTLSSMQGESGEYVVTSWHSEEKAIAMAVAKHTLNGGKAIFRVAVKCLGPAARAPSGAVGVPGSDLVDRMEW
jgi:hypothetical protein